MAETPPLKKQKLDEMAIQEGIWFLEQIIQQMQAETRRNGPTQLCLPADEVCRYRKSVQSMSERIYVANFQIIVRLLSGKILHEYHSPLFMHANHFHELKVEAVWKEIAQAKVLNYRQRLDAYLLELQQLFPNLGSITFHGKPYCDIMHIREFGMINLNYVPLDRDGAHPEEYGVETRVFGDIHHYESKTFCRWQSDPFTVVIRNSNGDVFSGRRTRVYLLFEISLSGTRICLTQASPQSWSWVHGDDHERFGSVFDSESVVILKALVLPTDQAKEDVLNVGWIHVDELGWSGQRHVPFTFTASSFDGSKIWTVEIEDCKKKVCRTITVYLDGIQKISSSQAQERFTRAWLDLREFDPEGKHPIYQGAERVRGFNTIEHYINLDGKNNLEWFAYLSE